ncbi:glyoxalase/bleomycin resistance/extradiol dioxygenase family protein, partial [Nitrospirillum viridazoti]
ELMQAPWVAEADPQTRVGWAHLALSLGSQAAVDATAARLDAAGLLISPPRQTGDGFYEAVVRTPDGIPIEITV